MMKIYMAPMEGLTGHIFRSRYEKHFGKGRIDKYFIPFISPNQTNGYTAREQADINPKNNVGMYAVPQIMANTSEMFLRGVELLTDLGYKEINLNVGCPSGTVVSKFRGAGFLAIPDELDRFLDEVLSAPRMKDVALSVKTRLGMESAEEFPRLLDIFNKYPLKELIVHPRVREDFYKNTPNMEAFEKALVRSVNPVCYNGDIFTRGNFVEITGRYGADGIFFDDKEHMQAQKLGMVMLGRGLVADPALINVIADDNPKEYKRDLQTEKAQIRSFVDDVFNGYLEAMAGDKNSMHKMKEIWLYIGQSFIGADKALKEIKKSQRICDYTAAVDTFFANADLKG